MYVWLLVALVIHTWAAPALPHDPGPLPHFASAESRRMVSAVTLRPASQVLAEVAGKADMTAPEDAWFAEDKLRHFFLSFAVTGMAFGTIRTTGLDGAPALLLAGAAAGAAGLWKEFYDRSIGRPFSRKDLVWDGLGIAAGLILASQAR